MGLFRSGALSRSTRRVVPAAIVAAGLVFGGAAAASACIFPIATKSSTQVDLRVLVVDDGQPMVGSITAQLDREGVPYTTVDLNAANRPTITEGFLSVVEKTGNRAKFQSVVLPNSSPAGLTAVELTTLHDFERSFGVRQVSAYTWPNNAVGTDVPFYSGSIDGKTGTLSQAARNDGFSYLTTTNAVTFDDFDPDTLESYGYVTKTRSDLPAGTSYTPFITMSVGGQTGSLMGVYGDNYREELVLSFGQNQYQQHSATLGHGIVEWMTRGIHLGEYRNYFSVHVDDVFMPDNLWSVDGKCTIGDGCDPVLYPEDADGATSRMTPDDAIYAANWYKQNKIYFDMTYNGNGYEEFKAANNKKDTLYDKLRSLRSSFRWMSHTWSHPYLGCVQDFTSNPWKCATDAKGNIQWMSENEIYNELKTNTTWGLLRFSIDKDAVVTGQHSGLASLPQMSTDNPNLANALKRAGVKWVGSDASREMNQRAASSTALTVPRYPMNIFYNAETKAQEVAEYNWIYTSRANGGSGLCEDNAATTTCIEPLSLTTGFDSYIVPLESRIALRHVTTNDPRPHYVHQSNLAGDRILYPVLNQLLAKYKATFNVSTTPIVNPDMSEAGELLRQQNAWNAQKNNVTATLGNGKITITGGSTRVDVPVTAGPNTSVVYLKNKYADSRSEWIDVWAKATKKLTLSSKDGGYPSYVKRSGDTPVAVAVAAPNKTPTEVVELNEADAVLVPELFDGQNGKN